jgi:hypothetical protein
MNLREMTNEQRRIYIDASQLHEAFMEMFSKNLGYQGGMHWKKSKGKQYLFRTSDRHGNGKSLGVRSDKTETIYAEFHKNKQQIRDSLQSLKERIKEQSRFCKAAKIQRVPRIVTAILRLFEQHRLLGKNLQIIGTNALYAYEAASGVFLDSSLLATKDMDVLWDVHSRLNLYSWTQVDVKGLLDILKKADKTFELKRKKSFRAVNSAGFMVDLVKPEPKPAFLQEIRQMGDEEDLAAAEIRNLQWLVSSPKFSQTVIGDDGFPATMVVPDPRAFALHKLWLSKQQDREPIKKTRDRDQSLAVCRLVLHYLPDYKFNPDELRMFPKGIVNETIAAIKGAQLPPGY